MIDYLLSLIAPHLCCGCAKLGTLLCDNCKKDITDDDFSICFLCGRQQEWGRECKTCRSPFQKTWCSSERQGVVRRLIDSYKFNNCYGAHKPLADLLVASLPQLPKNTVIVPIPTVASHVRQRGYDHTTLLAKRAAKVTGVSWKPLLVRVNHATQCGASRSQRIEQAKHAFNVKVLLDPSVPYLVVDDVVTTGATMAYAAEALKAAGAAQIWAAAIAHQPLD